MSVVKLPYKCKFCDHPGFVNYEHNGMLTEDRVNHWLKFVACDPCAEYQRQSRDLSRRLFTMAGNWNNLITYNPKAAGPLEYETREVFERTFRRLCIVIENKTHWGGLFNLGMVEDAMKSPSHTYRVVKSLLERTDQ